MYPTLSRLFLTTILNEHDIATNIYLGDNCIVFENFTASIGDLMVANLVYWRRNSGASKRIFATIKSCVIMCIDVYCHIIDKMM